MPACRRATGDHLTVVVGLIVQIYGRPTSRRIGAHVPISSRHVLPWCFRGKAAVWDVLLSH
jgi:hypothetical protein